VTFEIKVKLRARFGIQKTMGNASGGKHSDQIDKSYWQTNGFFIAQKIVFFQDMV
jgi:hypothetical protein